MDILINVVGQKLRTTVSNRRLVAGTQQYIKFIFTFSEDWEGLKVFAQFTQNDKSYNKYLENDNTVFLPPEITNGEFQLALQGDLGDITAKSFPLIFEADRDPVTSDASSTEITQTLYDQLVDLVLQNGGSSGAQYSVATVEEVKDFLGITNLQERS